MSNFFFGWAAALALAAGPVWAQTTPPSSADVDVTVVRLFPNTARSTLEITRPDGTQSVLVLENDKATTKNQSLPVGLQQLVRTLYQQGYQLQSTLYTQNTANSTYSTLLFIRRKQ